MNASGRPALKFLLSNSFTIVLVAAVAVGASLAGRALWDSVTAQDVPKAQPPPLAVLQEEDAKPKFEGEILGVFIGPPEAKVPDKFVTYEDVCGTQVTEAAGWDEAGPYDLKVALPEPFRLVPDSMNTGVVACGGTVYAARWEYSALQPSGYPGQLFIVRSRFNAEVFEAPAERIQATEIGGVPAVYIAPLSENGIGRAAGVVFPGDAVTTSIISHGIPADDLLKVAEIVAAAIQKGG